MVKAIQNGEAVGEDDIANLQKILNFVQDLDSVGVGANVTEGIAEGMTEAGWDTSAETLANNLETAINSALIINSPSERMKPAGEYVAAGIGEGMAGYDFAANAETMASSLEGALSASLNAATLRPVGVNAMAGLRAGIVAGTAGVVSAMRAAALSAVNAAKSELKINSPSKVFEDEVGVMAMKGMGKGVTEEAKRQARIMANAARFLTGEAREGAIGFSQNDNRKTYNQSSSVNLSGNNFYVRDETDIRSLAVEIAALTRRQQHGKGMRVSLA